MDLRSLALEGGNKDSSVNIVNCLGAGGFFPTWPGDFSLLQIFQNGSGTHPASYNGVLISPWPDLLPDVVGQNRYCLWKERSVHVTNCKCFLVTEAERKYVRRRAQFQHNRDASCHQFFSARQGAEGNLRNFDRSIRGTCTILCHRQKLGGLG